MNSILMKYMRSLTVVIFSAFIFFISLLLAFINSYSLNQELKLLETGSNRLSEIISSSSIHGLTDDQLDEYYDLIEFYAESIDANVIICDIDGKIKNVKSDRMPFNNTVPSDIIEETIEKGYYSFTGKPKGADGIVHISAKPFYDYGDVCGIVLITSNADLLSSIVKDMLWVFIIAFIASLAFGYAIMYFVTKKITDPLQQMSKVASLIAQGNFSKRVTVEGNNEISALATSLNTMADSLEKLDQLKSNFISGVSHELKTPMTTISGFIDGILDKTIPPEKYDYYLGVISDEIKRLSRLVSTLVNIARMDAGEFKLNCKKFDYTELLLTVSAQFEMKLSDKNINFVFSAPENSLYTYADYDAIYRVVYNLIDNALKFTNEGGTIELWIKFTKEGKLITGVNNTGIGINKDDLPFVFDKFYKSDKSRSEDSKSFGLGLYFCRYIINKHGENIFVRSEEGRFAEFVFTLPLINDKDVDNEEKIN